MIDPFAGMLFLPVVKLIIMATGKSKRNQGTGGQFDPNQSNGKKEEMKPQPNDKEQLKKKAFKEGQGDNDNTDTPDNKKYPHS